MKTKLTLHAVNKAVVKSTRYTIWDEHIKGFGLRVNADGTKTYVLKYLFQGRQRWFTIGKHGSPFTPETARREAQRLLGQAKGDVDPVERRQLDRTAGTTVSELCDAYLAAVDAGHILTRAKQPKKASTVATDRGRIERHIKPLLGRKRVAGITPADIQAFVFNVAAGATATDIKTKMRGRAIVEGGKGTATRTVGLLGGIFSFAVKMGYRPDNPVRGVERFADKKMERFLTTTEIHRFGAVLAKAESAWRLHEAAHTDWVVAGKAGPAPRMPDQAENPVALAALRLLLMTGARKSEILTLRWDWVDDEHGCLRLPDSKTGVKIVPLGAAALEVIVGLPRLDANPFVFPGAKRGSHLVGLPKIWERLRANAKLPNVRLHDLRHSFASVSAAAGDSLLLIEAWRRHYNTIRPHSSLGYRPPAPETATPPLPPSGAASLHLQPAMAKEATMH